MFSFDTADRMWNFLKDNIFAAAIVAIPHRVAPRKFRGMNIKGEVKRALNARKIHKRYRDCSNDFARAKLQNADDRLHNALEDARARHEQNVAQLLHDSPRAFWKHVHRSLGNKPNISSVKLADGSLSSSDKEIAEEFNRIFASAFIDEPLEDLPQVPDRAPDARIDKIDVNEYGIFRLLKSLPMRSSAGPDGISNLLLSKAGFTLCCVLKRFFAFLFGNGLLPSDWCKANISPVFKKGIVLIAQITDRLA